MLRQTKFKIKCFQGGNCVTCCKPREDSPYKRLCKKCGLKKRVQNQIKLKQTPWMPGKKGRPPLYKKAFVVRVVKKSELRKMKKEEEIKNGEEQTG